MVVFTLKQLWAKWACDRLTEDVDFGRKIIFSDEAHFDLGGNIFAFGTPKTRAHTLKSRRTQNESLFDEDFGSET